MIYIEQKTVSRQESCLNIATRLSSFKRDKWCKSQLLTLSRNRNADVTRTATKRQLQGDKYECKARGKRIVGKRGEKGQLADKRELPKEYAQGRQDRQKVLTGLYASIKISSRCPCGNLKHFEIVETRKSVAESDHMMVSSLISVMSRKTIQKIRNRHSTHDMRSSIMINSSESSGELRFDGVNDGFGERISFFLRIGRFSVDADDVFRPRRPDKSPRRRRKFGQNLVDAILKTGWSLDSENDGERGDNKKPIYQNSTWQSYETTPSVLRLTFAPRRWFERHFDPALGISGVGWESRRTRHSTLRNPNRSAATQTRPTTCPTTRHPPWPV